MNEPTELVQLQARRSPWISRPIDNTALDAFMSCPRKYFYSMVLNRRGRAGGFQSPALAYGTTWHSIMEAHFKTGGNIQAVTDAAVASWKDHGNADDHRTLQRAVTEYGKFLQTYGTHDQDAAVAGRTVGFPDQPVVECATELWFPGTIHPYTGKIDRIFELNGLYYVEDHKTTSAMGPTFFRQFDPSNQMMGYAGLAQLLTGLPIAGVRIAGHACLKTTSKHERQTILFSPGRLAEWVRNLNVWLGRLEKAHYVHEMQTATIGEGNLDEDEVDDLSAFPHNFNACAGKYGACSYVDVCTYPAELRNQILEAEFEDNPWNPLNPEDGE